MPITPLHFGLLAPANHWFRGKVSVASFVLVNLWIDAEAILAWSNDLPLPSHDNAGHTMLGAMITAVIVALPGVRSMSWALGSFVGAVSHILLDALVHPEMRPFEPVVQGNPLYLDLMTPLSACLLPLAAWFTAQSVTYGFRFVRRRKEQLFMPPKAV